MNIFYLDKNTDICAKYHVDRHVIKMILESAQLLCTAIRVMYGKKTIIITPLGKKKTVYLLPEETYYFKKTVKKIIMFNMDGELIAVDEISYKLILSSGLYIQTHINHPCSVWLRENLNNWLYVYDLMYSLEKEWQYRYDTNRRHKSVLQLENTDILDMAIISLPDKPMTKPSLAMPDEYKTLDPVESYQNYYRLGKKALLIYTKRNRPEWL
ncbi:MAG: hypothetical protein WC679_01005 [Bacteroidales bacterium]|jgi:hypothetical protein